MWTVFTANFVSCSAIFNSELVKDYQMQSISYSPSSCLPNFFFLPFHPVFNPLVSRLGLADDPFYDLFSVLNRDMNPAYPGIKNLGLPDVMGMRRCDIRYWVFILWKSGRELFIHGRLTALTANMQYVVFTKMNTTHRRPCPHPKVSANCHRNKPLKSEAEPYIALI